MGKLSLFVVATAVLLPALAGCGKVDFESRWEKRQYCSDLGRKVSSKIEAEDKLLNEEQSLSHKISYFEWNYCPAVDTCVMQKRSTMMAIEGKSTLYDSIGIRDLMTNEVLIGESASGRSLDSDAVDAFESKRDRVLSGCFRNKKLE